MDLSGRLPATASSIRLRVDTADRDANGSDAARTASSGNYTVFEKRCLLYRLRTPARTIRRSRRCWQVKGRPASFTTRPTKMLYFENAQLEFFGVSDGVSAVFFDARSDPVKRKDRVS